MTSPYRQQGGFRFDGCKWCRGRGCTFCSGEYEKYAAAMAKPIFTARLDNPEEMEEAKRVIGREAIERAFGPDGGGIQEIELNAALTMVTRELRKVTTFDQHDVLKCKTCEAEITNAENGLYRGTDVFCGPLCADPPEKENETNTEDR